MNEVTSNIGAASAHLEACLKGLIDADANATPVEALLISPLISRAWRLHHELYALIEVIGSTNKEPEQ